MSGYNGDDAVRFTQAWGLLWDTESPDEDECSQEIQVQTFLPSNLVRKGAWQLPFAGMMNNGYPLSSISLLKYLLFIEHHLNLIRTLVFSGPTELGPNFVHYFFSFGALRCMGSKDLHPPEENASAPMGHIDDLKAAIYPNKLCLNLQQTMFHCQTAPEECRESQ